MVVVNRWSGPERVEGHGGGDQASGSTPARRASVADRVDRAAVEVDARQLSAQMFLAERGQRRDAERPAATA